MAAAARASAKRRAITAAPSPSAVAASSARATPSPPSPPRSPAPSSAPRSTERYLTLRRRFLREPDPAVGAHHRIGRLEARAARPQIGRVRADDRVELVIVVEP